MNLDQRYQCPGDPGLTVGATQSETEPPPCPICREPMTLIKTSDVRSGEARDARFLERETKPI